MRTYAYNLTVGVIFNVSNNINVHKISALFMTLSNYIKDVINDMSYIVEQVCHKPGGFTFV